MAFGLIFESDIGVDIFSMSEVEGPGSVPQCPQNSVRTAAQVGLRSIITKSRGCSECRVGTSCTPMPLRGQEVRERRGLLLLPTLL